MDVRKLIFFKKMNKFKEKGFTLVELLIVIALIAILSVAVLATINPIEQANNKTSSFIVEYRGDKFTLPNLLRHLYISMDNYKTIYARLRRGWSVERACDEPI